MRLTVVVLSLLCLVIAALPATAGPQDVPDGDPATSERIDPADPAAFAVGVSQIRFAAGEAESVTLSRDDTFADSLAGAPLSGEGPLLFTATDNLPQITRDEIARVLPDGGRVYLLGGTAAVSGDVAAALEGEGYDVIRLAGPSRVETALAIADEVRDIVGDTGMVALARGFGPADNPTAAWADSVAAGAWAAAEGHPIVISPTDQLPDSVSDWLSTDNPDQTVLLGGEAALSAAVFDAAPSPARVSGLDRAATAGAIATQLLAFPAVGARTAVVFNAYEALGWTRGLSVAGLAAGLGAPVLAVNTPGIPPATASLLTAGGDEPEVETLIAGPTSEVSEQIVAELEELDAGPPAPERPEPGVPRLVSVNDDGEPGDDDSTSADLGGDGTVVAFTSKANNLGETDSDRQRDGMVRDTVAGTTREITGSASPFQIGATSGQALSGDSRYVVAVGFGIDQNNVQVYDLVDDAYVSITPMTDVDPDTGARPNVAVISDDGQWIAFQLQGSIYRQRVDGSDRTRLFAGREDGFDLVFDLRMSGDGSLVAFRSTREDLSGSFDAQLFLIDSAGGAPVLVSRGIDGQPAEQQVADIAMSADGSTVAFSTRAANMREEVSGNVPHLYVYDVDSGTIRLVDRTAAGAPATQGVETELNGFGLSLTDDGRTIAFTSEDGELAGAEFSSVRGHIMTADLTTGAIQVEVEPPEGGSVRFPTLSGDGSRIAWDQTGAFGDTVQVYLMDRR